MIAPGRCRSIQQAASGDIRGVCSAASRYSKSDHRRLAQQNCHPEPFGYAQDKLREGPHGEILRCTQNDMAEWLHRKVYQCSVVRFSRHQKQHEMKLGIFSVMDFNPEQQALLGCFRSAGRWLLASL